MIAPLSVAHALRTFGVVAAATICFTAAGYYAFALYCARDFFRRDARRQRGFGPPITILKPICGLDRGAYENFASFCRQHYPQFQILFGSDDENDPGIAVARQVARDFPDVDIRIVIHRGPPTANPKVGNLAAMAAEARYGLLLVSDSDIRVGPWHLSTLAEPMADPGVGVVTCLYRSDARGFAGHLDALGLSTDFQPSVLVARKLEGISFGMGSGTLIRRTALAAAGGFGAIADFLADDYLLGNLPVRSGYRAELSADVVEHELSTATLRGLVEHQIRWNRGIRAMRPLGYAGLLLTQGTPASLGLLILAGDFPGARVLAAVTLALRLWMAWYVAAGCLRDAAARRALWLVPARDLFGFGLWLCAFFGDSVVWRGRRFRLAQGGRLVSQGVDGISETESELARTGIAS
jgi:ceramide glucosyltransferase